MDDGSDLELWTEDENAGLRFQVTPAGELFASRADGPRYPNARITIDPSTHDLIVDDPQGVIGPPVDLGWLRRRLDPELCAAIAERADRKRRGDRHGWKDGDRPRVSLGDRVRFCDVFPSSWDVLVIHKRRQYGLIDRYCIAEDANQVPISVEVIDLSRGKPVGSADISPAPPSEPHTRVWRTTSRIVDQILFRVQEDADEWFGLVNRSEDIARVARRLRTWDADRMDPDAVVRLALSGVHDRDADADAEDRVTALGQRAVPALHRALQTEDPGERYRAASLLAENGDPAGCDELASALITNDDDLEDYVIFDGLVKLGERSLAPLLEVLQRSGPDRRFAVMEALVALGIRDERIRDVLIHALSTDAAVASLLIEYGGDSPAAIEALRQALVRRLDEIDAGTDDITAHDDAIDLADALRGLGALSPPLEARVESALVLSQFADRTEDSPDSDDLDGLDDLEALADVADAMVARPGMTWPVQAVVRPGRNEPCWCGSNKKYKRCHLDSDELERRGRS